MDYEKKYKEAFEKARQLCAYPTTKPFISDLQDLFPELKESEDERIKKEIISFIQDDIDEINLKVSGDYDDRDEDDIAHQNWCKKAIAWLENIPYTIDHEKREGFHLGYKAGLEKQGEQKPTDEDAKESLRTEYEKGRADAIAEIRKKWDDCRRRKDILSFLESLRLKED